MLASRFKSTTQHSAVISTCFLCPSNDLGQIAHINNNNNFFCGNILEHQAQWRIIVIVFFSFYRISESTTGYILTACVGYFTSPSIDRISVRDIEMQLLMKG